MNRKHSIRSYTGRELTGRERKAEYQRRARAALAARGLTTRNTPRTKRVWPELRGFTRARRHRIQVNSYYAANLQRGLTARGTARILGKLPAREAAWRALRATIQTQTTE